MIILFHPAVLDIKINDGGVENMYWTNDGYYMKVNDSGYAVEPIADNSGYKDPPYFMSVRLIKKN